MNEMQLQVEEFHEEFNAPMQPFNDPKLPERAELRAKLILEEAEETAAALRRGDLIETIDGLCDTLYVVFGTAVEMGIDLQVFMDEVHASNMSKRGGGFREDGKILKGPNYFKPDLVRIFESERRYWKNAT